MTSTTPMTNTIPMDMPTYKIVVVGDAKVGKTTFIKRHLTGEYTKDYVATLGVEVHPLTFHTNYGPIRFNCWDCAGDDRFGGLRDAYWMEANGALVFGSVTDKDSHTHLKEWIDRVGVKTANVVVCMNKVDMKERVVMPGEIVVHRMYEPHLKIYEVSARSNYQFEKPFLALARTLTGRNDLVFVEAPALSPPQVSI